MSNFSIAYTVCKKSAKYGDAFSKSSSIVCVMYMCIGFGLILFFTSQSTALIMSTANSPYQAISWSSLTKLLTSTSCIIFRWLTSGNFLENIRLGIKGLLARGSPLEDSSYCVLSKTLYIRCLVLIQLGKTKIVWTLTEKLLTGT